MAALQVGRHDEAEVEAFASWKLLLHDTAGLVALTVPVLANSPALAPEQPNEDGDEVEFSGRSRACRPAASSATGWSVHGTASTEINLDGGTLGIGALLRSKASRGPIGSIDAHEIECDDGGDD
jgi:hypothetical protein